MSTHENNAMTINLIRTILGLPRNTSNADLVDHIMKYFDRLCISVGIDSNTHPENIIKILESRK